MANSYKNIVITPNIGNTADPKIVFSGGNTTVNTDISLFVYPTSNGTLSFEGSAGQLFSVTNDLTGSIFSVNDVSGLPSLEIFANGQVNIAQFGGAVTVNSALTVTNTFTVGTSTYFMANGNVAMGVSTSSRAFTVYRGSGVTSDISIRSNANAEGAEFYLAQATNDAYVWNRPNAPIFFGTNNTERMRLSAAGNLGIGTDPSHRLHVNGNALVSGVFYNNSIADNGGNQKFSWSTGSGSAIIYYGPLYGSGSEHFLAVPDSSTGRGSTILGDGFNINALAFISPASVEYFDGTTWTAGTVDSTIQNLFTGKHASVFGGLNLPTSQAGVRFTWTSAQISMYQFINSLMVNHSTQGNSVYILLEYSIDGGSTWTTYVQSSNFSSWPGYTTVHGISNMPSNTNRIRISIIRNGASNGNSIDIGQIAMLASYGTSGTNKLFDWDFSRNISLANRLYTANNIGINISVPTLNAPGRVLHIHSGTNEASAVHMTNGGSGSAAANGLLLGKWNDNNNYFWDYGAVPIIFGTNNTERVRLDANGNLGVGLTPSAWGSNYRSIQVNSGGGGVVGSGRGIDIVNNAYANNTNWRYFAGAAAARYNIDGGQHAWHIAASGTADANIAFTEAMTLVANGNLGVGTTSPTTKLHVVGSQIRLVNAADTQNILLQADSARATVQAPNGTLAFDTLTTERMRIDSSGRLLIAGNSSYSDAKLQLVNGDDSGGSGTRAQIAFQFNGVGYSHYIASRHNSAVSSDGNALIFYLNNSVAQGGSSAPGTGTVLSQFMGTQTHIWYTANTERMRLDSNGNVGIGASPGGRLTVQNSNISSNGTDGISFSDGTRGISLLITGNTYSSFNLGPNETWLYPGSSTNLFNIGGTGPIRILTNQTERIRISNTGNVGIGNTAPGHTLRVQGDISLSGGVHANGSLGTAGHVLTTNGTTSYWAAANVSNVTGTLSIANGGTNSSATPTQYGIAYGTGTGYAFTAQSSLGQFLYGIGNLGAPVWVTLDLDYMPNAWIKKTVRVATTANITLSNLQTVDGISLSANDRVLVKNQSNPVQNGIYSVVNGGNWARQDGTFNMPGSMVSVLAGAVNAGSTYRTNFKATDTVGVSAMNWYQVLDEATGATRSRSIAMSILFG